MTKRIFSLGGDRIELTCNIVHVTDRAFLIRVDEQEEWIPKSQIEDSSYDEKLNITTLVIPEWLAIEKNLI